MLYLKTLYDKDIFPKKEKYSAVNWERRKTVKIILLNEKNKIALVTNHIHKCHLLPGGGINNKENVWNAANRECREETNTNIKKGRIIGIIKEYRARDGKIYETFGLTACTSKKIFKDLRTEDEKNNELVVGWHEIHNADKIFQHQYELLMAGKIKFYNTAFNVVRDKIFFDTALKHNLICLNILPRIIQIQQK